MTARDEPGADVGAVQRRRSGCLRSGSSACRRRSRATPSIDCRAGNCRRRSCEIEERGDRRCIAASQPRFAELAGIAVTALASAAALAFAAFLWNSRKLPAPVVARRSARGARLRAALGLDRPLHTAARLLAGRDPVARAGFLFTLRALARSASHRVTMMASAAVGVAAAAVMLRSVDLGRAMRGSDPRCGSIDSACSRFRSC